MTKARTNASVAPAVGRNMVINGAMNVAQRSASVTGLGNTDVYATLDRWRINGHSNNAGRLTMTQTADGPNGISANCLKLDCTTVDTSIAAAEFLVLQHRMEGQNLQRIGKGVAGAQQITISFYVKANASFTFGAELDDSDNTRQITKLFDTTTDWVRHSFVIPADVDDGSSPFDDDNATSLNLNFWLHAGATYAGGTLNTASFANTTAANRAAGIDSLFSNTANNFFLTGVQIEVGPVATEFEQEDVSLTLRKCERYFQRWDGGKIKMVGTGVIYAGAQVLGYLPFFRQMRATPSMSVSSADFVKAYRDGQAINANDSDSPFDEIRACSARFNIALASNPSADGEAAVFQLTHDSAEYIHADAEL